MDAPYFNGEPDRGVRVRTSRERAAANCARCGKHTIGHQLPDATGRDRALCPEHYGDEMAARLHQGAA